MCVMAAALTASKATSLDGNTDLVRNITTVAVLHADGAWEFQPRINYLNLGNHQ